MEDGFGILCRFLLLVATGIAVVFQVLFVMLDCQLVSFTGADGDERDFGLFKLHTSMVQGLGNSTNTTNISTNNTATNTTESFSISNGCVDYSWRGEESTYIKFAQASNLLAIVGGGVGFLLVLFETCCLRVCCARVLELSAYGMAILFSGLIFLVLKSQICDDNDGCTASRGSIFNITAMALYGFAVIIMICTPKPKPFFRQLCCGSKDKVGREEAYGVDQPSSPEQPGKLEIQEGDSWGASPQGRTQYE